MPVQTLSLTSIVSSTDTPDIAAILDLILQNGQITARTLIETLHISKATATRKLANMVEQGKLERHGEGRAVYYTLPQSEAQAYTPTYPAVSHLQHQIETLLPSIRADFQVESLLAMTESTRADIEITFKHLPDLPTFFALERKLSLALGFQINLVLPLADRNYTPHGSNL